uniref:Uncharacterized protein n=1 Tax=Chionoecetes opilio bacilliform virus TaxID=1825681 RepID=A0A1Q3DL18_9VIRU|nr:hypothetical protein SCV_126 [Chionoecetes opilio bacilliform virus]
MKSVVDEAGMCVSNMENVRKRILSMGPEETHYVDEVSKKCLTNLIRIAHSPDSDKVKQATTGMITLLLQNIYSADAINSKFLSYNTTAVRAALMDKDVSSANRLVTSIMGTLDPLQILNHSLNDSGDSLSNGVDGIMSVLRGFNPIKIHDYIVIVKCEGCEACTALQNTLEKDSIEDPIASLMYFLRCMNHKRLDFGGDLESAIASPAYIQNVGNNTIIEVPIRRLLLSCVDFLGGDNDRTLSNMEIEAQKAASIAAMDVSHPPILFFADDNEPWVTALFERVSNMPLDARAFMCNVYCFMVFSRHISKTADPIKLFLYTIFARFLYASTEIMFHTHPGASSEVDNGRFLTYVDSLVKTVVLSGTLEVEKTFMSWRNNNISIAPLLGLISGSWRSVAMNSAKALNILSSVTSKRNP